MATAVYEREAVRVETIDPYHALSLEASGFVLIEGDDLTGNGATAPEKTTDLDNMTVAELTEYAGENGIELDGATKKADIRAAIDKAAEAPAGDNEDGDELL